MRICAVDARTDSNNDKLLGVAWYSLSNVGWVDNWPDAREALINAVYDGCTLVAHNAEAAVTKLLFRNQESFRVHYCNERWSGGQWTYDREMPAAQVWDSFTLSGGLSIVELATVENVELHSPPGRIQIRPIREEERVCWDHKRLACPVCLSETSRYAWVCQDHMRGECLECWQLATVETIYKYMERYCTYLEGYGLKPKRTVGGAAVSLWRVLDNPEKVWLRDSNADKLARLGYFGGRVEAYKLGHLKDVYYADISSMYASIMAVTPMPDPAHTEYNNSAHLDTQWMDCEGVSECDVTVPPCHVPPLPVRYGEQLVYPVGSFHGIFTHVELRAAITRGTRIDHVYQTVYATETCKPFDTFANGLLRYRAELKASRNPLERLVKLLLNSLPGRMGLKLYQENMYVSPLPPGSIDTDWPNHELLVKRDHILIRSSSTARVRDPYSNPLWAATITGYARVRLLEYMELQGYSLAYCDTDSIISTEPIIGLDEGIGCLEDQGEYQEGWILSPKLYHLSGGKRDDKTSSSGVPKSVALRYMRDKTAHWNRPIGIFESWGNDLYPGELQIMVADRRLNLTKRHLLDPWAIESENGYSDTTALTFAGHAPLSEYMEGDEWRFLDEV